MTIRPITRSLCVIVKCDCLYFWSSGLKSYEAKLYFTSFSLRPSFDFEGAANVYKYMQTFINVLRCMKSFFFTGINGVNNRLATEKVMGNLRSRGRMCDDTLVSGRHVTVFRWPSGGPPPPSGKA